MLPPGRDDDRSPRLGVHRLGGTVARFPFQRHQFGIRVVVEGEWESRLDLVLRGKEGHVGDVAPAAVLELPKDSRAFHLFGTRQPVMPSARVARRRK